jgi:hypothetical protein
MSRAADSGAGLQEQLRKEAAMSIMKTAAAFAAASALAVGVYASDASAIQTCTPHFPLATGGTPCGIAGQKGLGDAADVSTQTPGSRWSYSAKLQQGSLTQVVLIDSQGFIVKKKNGGGTNCSTANDAPVNGVIDNKFTTLTCDVATPFSPVGIRIVAHP